MNCRLEGENMENKINWKRTIAGIIIIFIVVWFGTAIVIGNIANLSVATIATSVAFASIMTYLISKIL